MSMLMKIIYYKNPKNKLARWGQVAEKQDKAKKEKKDFPLISKEERWQNRKKNITVETGG